MIQQSRSWAYTRQNYNPERLMHANVHSSSSHNSQDMEAN